jgi:phosphatidylinositol glycan class B
LGLFAWLFFVNKTKINSLIITCVGSLLVLALGVCLDSWFYGEFVFTPWNYFYSNIVDDMASVFGVSPWYFYLKKLISFPNYMVGICFALSLIILLIKKPKNIFLWCFIPFVLAHSFVPHKEERFIFPLAYLFAVILTTAYSFLYDFIQKRTFTKILNYVFLTLFAATNIVGLLVMSHQGADKGRIAMTKYVYDNYKDRPINVLFFSNSNPYNPWHFKPIRFYAPSNLQNQIYIRSLEELNDYLPVEGYENLLFVKKPDLQNIDVVRAIEEKKYVFKQQSVPSWIEKTYKLHDNFPTMWIYTLYIYEE